MSTDGSGHDAGPPLDTPGLTAAGTPGRARLVATVRGAVQGVGFRWFVQREAQALGLEGWVANRSDGTVEVVAEGRAVALDGLVDRLREGPPAAAVRAVETRIEPVRGLAGGFGIQSGDHPGD